MNSLTLFSPTRELSGLQNEVSRLFDRFFPMSQGQGGAETMVTGLWSPWADLAETDDSYVITLDLPGVRREDVNISWDQGTLVVSGERHMVNEENNRYHRIERLYGRFQRTFTFGRQVNPESIEARYENGVLTVFVGKAEQSKPRRIDIS